jgi:alpha-L-fucosidase
MMKKLLIPLLLIFITSPTLFAQTKMIGNETDAQKEQRMQWWKDARFGMFIHFGLYSEAARHEWVKAMKV